MPYTTNTHTHARTHTHISYLEDIFQDPQMMQVEMLNTQTGTILP